MCPSNDNRIYVDTNCASMHSFSTHLASTTHVPIIPQKEQSLGLKGCLDPSLRTFSDVLTSSSDRATVGFHWCAVDAASRLGKLGGQSM